LQCEELIQDEFGLQCNFEVMDAVRKLERLGIITRVSSYIFLVLLCCQNIGKVSDKHYRKILKVLQKHI
jgi:hypothetical protein